jgi:tRNA G18 (ribose-2'-O)-methylase SpoU
VPIDLHFLTESALDDARLADYRDLQDRRLGEDSGRFVAESELVVRKLLATDLRVCSLLLTAPRLASARTLAHGGQGRFPGLRGAPGRDGPDRRVSRASRLPGHRRTAREPVIPANARTVVVLVDLVDVDNLGAMARNAAAFGADAMLLSPRCADPFYRKAVRTSAGAVLSLPIVRATRWPEDLLALREQHGLSSGGRRAGRGCDALGRFLPPARLAVLFGSEGPGLDEETKHAPATRW